ncbi:MAG: hypothetical protein COC01_09265 [Bacteroidetes bacterium]|nr:MAG: hypothetical protein COC01_09265 [Bacteroidota bacterium]
MKYKISIVASILSLAGIILYFQFGYQIIGVLLTVVAPFLVMKDMVQFTRKWQYVLFVVQCAIIGYLTDDMSQSSYILTGLMILVSIGIWARNYFVKYIGYFTNSWVELSYLLVSIGIYIYANIEVSSSWIGWVSPGVYIALGIMFFVSGVTVAKKSKAFIQNNMIRAGEKAPTFVLPDQDGNDFDLNDVIGKKNILLIFVMGDWCPACHIKLRTYERERKRFAEKNVMALAIGPDPVGINREMVERLELEYKVLSDEETKVAQAYSISMDDPGAGTTVYAGGKSPLPASFLIDLEGIIKFTSSPDNPGEILSPEGIFPALDSLKASVSV